MMIIDGNTMNKPFQLATRNIQRVLYRPQLVRVYRTSEKKGANVYDILKRKYLILSKDAVASLTERLADDRALCVC